jgi:hypothetical protein
MTIQHIFCNPWSVAPNICPPTNWNRTLTIYPPTIKVHPRLTRRVPLVEQELPTLPEHLSSSPVFSGVRATRSFCIPRKIPPCSFLIFTFTWLSFLFQLLITMKPVSVLISCVLLISLLNVQPLLYSRPRTIIVVSLSLCPLTFMTITCIPCCRLHASSCTRHSRRTIFVFCHLHDYLFCFSCW